MSRLPVGTAGAAALAAVLLAAVTACADDEDEAAKQGPLDAGPPVRLALVVDPGRGARPVESTLTCDGGEAVASGAIADRGEDRVCAHVRSIADLLLGPPRTDADRVCAAIYGGPQRARVTGTIGGGRVERSFSREDGCAIADWDRAVPLLPSVQEGPGPSP